MCITRIKKNNLPEMLLLKWTFCTYDIFGLEIIDF